MQERAADPEAAEGGEKSWEGKDKKTLRTKKTIGKDMRGNYKRNKADLKLTGTQEQSCGSGDRSWFWTISRCSWFGLGLRRRH